MARLGPSRHHVRKKKPLLKSRREGKNGCPESTNSSGKGDYSTPLRGSCVFLGAGALVIVAILVVFLVRRDGGIDRRTHFGDFGSVHTSIPANATPVVKRRLNALLDEILVPRVPGTQGHARVQEVIKDHFSTLKSWDIEEDTFSEETPIGRKNFNNIIPHYRRDSPWKLLICAHYDSKLFPNESFLGATDSAASVVIMMAIAEALTERWSANELSWLRNSAPLSVSFVFFDGEEAFVKWDATRDALYGSRHLAQKWSREPSKTAQSSSAGSAKPGKRIQEIELLLLCDLIGAQEHGVIGKGEGGYLQSFFPDTNRIHSWLMSLETRLSGHLTTNSTGKRYMGRDYRFFYQNVEDDFLPFRERRVKTYSLMPYPFPNVWHKLSDDRSALDMDSLVDCYKLLLAFIVEYVETQHAR